MEGGTMTSRRGSFFWGLVLLLAGAFLLLVTTDVLPELDSLTWAIICTMAAVVLLIGYLLTGWRNWPYLFPAAVSGATAALLWLVEADVEGSAAAGLFMAIISIPFWIGFLVDPKKNRWALIPGWAVAAVGVILLLESVVADNVFVSLILLAIAFPFLVVFLLDRRQWWALIPAYVLAVLGTIFLVLGEDSELLPVLIMFALALPFLVVFLINREYWWALIPAFTLGVIGIFLLLTISGDSAAWAPALIVFGIALPFFVIYYLKRDQWWALIPAGVLTGAGVATIVATSDLSDGAIERLASAAILASLALVFGYLWWKRKLHQTDWAGVLALILSVGALAIVILGLRMEIFWALALIVFGGWLLFRAARPRSKPG
jgi:hypothetical protein